MEREVQTARYCNPIGGLDVFGATRQSNCSRCCGSGSVKRDWYSPSVSSTVSRRSWLTRSTAAPSSATEPPSRAKRSFTVECEQRQHQMVRRPRSARRRTVRVGARGELQRERTERELRHPQMVAHHGLTQQLRVDRDTALETVEPRRRIEQPTAHGDLSEVPRAEESEGRLLQVVELLPPRLRLVDDPPEVLKIAIHEIDALPANREPRAAVDPRSPFRAPPLRRRESTRVPS